MCVAERRVAKAGKASCIIGIIGKHTATSVAKSATQLFGARPLCCQQAQRYSKEIDRTSTSSSPATKTKRKERRKEKRKKRH